MQRRRGEEVKEYGAGTEKSGRHGVREREDVCRGVTHTERKWGSSGEIGIEESEIAE